VRSNGAAEPLAPEAALGPGLRPSLEKDLEVLLAEWRELCALKRAVEEQIAAITDLLYARKE
jgi:hypothetical protein